MDGIGLLKNRKESKSTFLDTVYRRNRETNMKPSEFSTNRNGIYHIQLKSGLRLNVRLNNGVLYSPNMDKIEDDDSLIIIDDEIVYCEMISKNRENNQREISFRSRMINELQSALQLAQLTQACRNAGIIRDIEEKKDSNIIPMKVVKKDNEIADEISNEQSSYDENESISEPATPQNIDFEPTPAKVVGEKNDYDGAIIDLPIQK